MCLDRARLLPSNLRRSQLQLVDALCDVMNLIFDRSASLLPGYFIVNELLKLYPDYKQWPHWVCIFYFILHIRFVCEFVCIIYTNLSADHQASCSAMERAHTD